MLAGLIFAHSIRENSLTDPLGVPSWGIVPCIKDINVLTSPLVGFTSLEM